MHIHSLVALALAVTTSALPSLPECLMNMENQPRACREVGPAQSKLEIVDGQKQQNNGGLQGQIEYVDQQMGKEIECPGCGKNIVGDLAQSGSIGHNNMVTGQGEQQLDIISNGMTHEEWTGMGQKEGDVMPHGQKSNFNNLGQNQKRNQHFGQLYNGQSNTHGSVNMDTGDTQQDELFNKGQGMTQEFNNGMGQANGRIQEHATTHQWGNQLFQGQNQEGSELFMTGQGQNHQQEQFNKGTHQIESLFNTGGNANGIVQEFNKGGQGIRQRSNGQQMSGINQLSEIGQGCILMAINPNNHQQEEFNKGQETQQLNPITQQTQEMFKNGQTNNIQARNRVTEQQFTEGQNKQHQQINGGLNHQGQNMLSAGPVMSKPINEEWTIQNGKQQEQWSKDGNQQELFSGQSNTQQELMAGQNNQGQQELITGPSQSHQTEQWTNPGNPQELFNGPSQTKQMNPITGNQQELFPGQNNQHQQEQWTNPSNNHQQELIFSPQQMLDFISSQTKTGQQKWVREQVVRDGKLMAVWTCVN